MVSAVATHVPSGERDSADQVAGSLHPKQVKSTAAIRSRDLHATRGSSSQWEDQIDLDHNQDILITPCLMEGRRGFWILPVFKGTNLPNPEGHLPKGVIEVSLIERLPNIAPGAKVSVEILGE